MGTLFMVNPPKKRRTAAQKRATAKMIAANKKKRRGTKKRRRPATKTTSRKRTTKMAAKKKRATKKRATKRRSPVTSLRRHSVYLTNPRRRRRSYRSNPVRRGRRRHRRNPALFATLRQGAMDAGATLVGGAAARMVSGLVPLPKEGVTGAAVGLGVALAVGFAARKVVSHDTARFITAGAMQVPIKNLITSFVPQAGAFLGDYDNVGAYALPGGDGMGNYLTPGMYGVPSDSDVEIGVYE